MVNFDAQGVISAILVHVWLEFDPYLALTDHKDPKTGLNSYPNVCFIPHISFMYIQHFIAIGDWIQLFLTPKV